MYLIHNRSRNTDIAGVDSFTAFGQIWVLMRCFSRNSHFFSVSEWRSPIHTFIKISQETWKMWYNRFLKIYR